MSNFVKLYNDITEHWLWCDPVKLKWWLDLLLMSQRSNTGCGKGEIPIGITSLAKRWGSNKATVSRFLDKLSKSGLIKRSDDGETDSETAVATNVKRIIISNSEPYTSERNAFETAGVTIPETKKRARAVVKKPSDKEDEETDPEYKNKMAYLEKLKNDYPNVMSMTKPLTYEQCEALRKDGYSKDEIRGILSQMENFKGLRTKYNSAFLTARNWLQRSRK